MSMLPSTGRRITGSWPLMVKVGGGHPGPPEADGHPSFQLPISGNQASQTTTVCGLGQEKAHTQSDTLWESELLRSELLGRVSERWQSENASAFGVWHRRVEKSQVCWASPLMLSIPLMPVRCWCSRWERLKTADPRGKGWPTSMSGSSETLPKYLNDGMSKRFTDCLTCPLSKHMVF